MGDLANRLAAAYVAQPLAELVVPEWGRSLYVRPITIRQLTTIGAATSELGVALAVLECCAKTVDGGPAFDQADLDAIKNYSCEGYSARVVDRVAGELLRLAKAPPGGTITEAGVDDAEKK
jgi:hypothetical protein